MKSEAPTLPLLSRTPQEWAAAVMVDPLELLNDHAHLEKKAASNALEMMSRWPGGRDERDWVAAMTAIAQDEAVHLNMVTRILRARGGHLKRAHRNPYTRGLHELVRLGEGHLEILDRLLVAALIEARSCERFSILATYDDDTELANLYRQLWQSELGHYAAFLDLAGMVCEVEMVRDRWGWMLEEECRLMDGQPAGCRLHSGANMIRAA